MEREVEYSGVGIRIVTQWLLDWVATFDTIEGYFNPGLDACVIEQTEGICK